MPDAERTKLDEVFVSVRSAYRLLFVFQQRVMEMIKFVGTELGFSYAGGNYRWTGGPPRNGSGSLDRWAWDYLGFYLYEFAFQPREVEGHQLSLSIVIMCDSGLYDADANVLDVANYAPEEQSHTRLFFIAAKDAESELEEEMDEIIEELAQSRACISKGKETGSGVLFYKSYDLSDFVQEAKAREALQDFRTTCGRSAIPI